MASILENIKRATEYMKEIGFDANMVDDVYLLYEAKNNDICIRIEVIIKLLKCSKTELKNTLMSSYTENVDYTTKKAANPSKIKGSKTRGSNNYCEILLTSTCAKLICIRSNTRNHSQIRECIMKMNECLQYGINHVAIKTVPSVLVTTSLPPKCIRKNLNVNVRFAVWNQQFGMRAGVGPCYCCQQEICWQNYHCGHIIAVAKGGSNELSNLKPVCAKCNYAMNTHHMEEYKLSLNITKV